MAACVREQMPPEDSCLCLHSKPSRVTTCCAALLQTGLANWQALCAEHRPLRTVVPRGMTAGLTAAGWLLSMLLDNRNHKISWCMPAPTPPPPRSPPPLQLCRNGLFAQQNCSLLLTSIASPLEAHGPHEALVGITSMVLYAIRIAA